MKVSLRGDFVEEDLVAIQKLLKEFDRKNPKRFYSMFIDRRNQPLDKVTEEVKRIYDKASNCNCTCHKYHIGVIKK